jgi:phage-related protein
MSADFEIAFGSYDYGAISGLTVQKLTDGLEVKQRIADTPGRHGNYTAGGLIAPRRFSLSGLLVGTSATDLRDKWEAFRAAHAPGVPAQFYQHSDRYVWAEVEGIGKAEFNELARVHLEWDVDFFCSDPFAYAHTPGAQTGLAAGGTVSPGGTAYALPLWTIVVGTIGTITIENETTGQEMVFVPTQTGTYLIDSRLETITRSGVDKSAEMNGEFLRCNVGANTLTVNVSGGAVVTSLRADWNDRYV